MHAFYPIFIVYHKVYVLKFEAHIFDGLCKKIITWGPWLPTQSILATLSPEKVVLIWFQA